jgi:hypothetical protein
MPRLGRSVQVIALLSVFAACAGATQQAKTTPPPVNGDAAALQQFNQRIEAYLAVHADAVSKTAKPKQSKDSAKIQAARETLAATIQTLRKDAKPGDIFTPAVRARFRKVLYPEFKGREGGEVREQMEEDAAEGVPLKVNGKYPEKASVTTMAPNLLAQLPVLPKNLEYRIVGKTLILRDIDANLIVDFMPNAVPVAIRERDER